MSRWHWFLEVQPERHRGAKQLGGTIWTDTLADVLAQVRQAIVEELAGEPLYDGQHLEVHIRFDTSRS